MKTFSQFLLEKQQRENNTPPEEEPEGTIDLGPAPEPTRPTLGRRRSDPSYKDNPKGPRTHPRSTQGFKSVWQAPPQDAAK